MRKLLLILLIFSFPYLSFSQGSFTQTTTADFSNNVNFNVSILNDEIKLIIDKGTGAQGNLNVLSGNYAVIDSPRTSVTGNNNSGLYFINVASTAGFNINDEVLIITSMHSSVERAGQYEFRRIKNKTATILYFYDALKKTYDIGNTHQVVIVPNYNNVTIAGTLTCSPWNGLTGGILVFRATGLVKVTSTGKISVDTMGYRYGTQSIGQGADGEGILGNGGHGGGQYFYQPQCQYTDIQGGGGGGGGHVTFGPGGTGGYCTFRGAGGDAVGDALLSKMFFGGAGGGGGTGGISPNLHIGARGGRGAGIIYITSDSLSIENYISSNPQAAGTPGGYNGGSGNRGAGGTIYINSQKNIAIGNNYIVALVGNILGKGRIRIDAPSITGTSDPNYGYSAISYAFLGSSVSPIITKPSINGWHILTYNADTSLIGTSVRFDVLDTSDSVLLSNIQSGSNLNILGLSQSINSIKLKALLMNSNGDRTPTLSDWSLTWDYLSAPSPPTLISPVNGAWNVSVTPLLDWNDVAYATSYRVQIFNNVYLKLYDTVLSVSQAIVSSGYLTSNTQYFWRVSAANSFGTSEYSPLWYFTTITTSAPNVPVLSQPVNNATGQPTTLTFKWYKAIEILLYSKQLTNKGKTEDFPDAISKYWFEYGTDPTLTTVISRDSSLTDTTTALTGLNNLTQYYWRVKAKNQIGWSGFSSIWSFTTVPPIPLAPTLISPPNNATNQVPNLLLDWSAVQYAVSYKVQIANDSLFTSMVFDTSNVNRDSLRVRPGLLLVNTKYFWRVNAVNISGTGPWSTVWNFRINPTGLNISENVIPNKFKLYNNYPNPFNPVTKIKFDVARHGGSSTGDVKIVVYDIKGHEVQTLVNESLKPGTYEATFDGSRLGGSSTLTSGVYFYKIQVRHGGSSTGDFTETKRMLMLK